MARKSRKHKAFGNEGDQKTVGFNTGIYARLSVEDKELGSSSIENQILIAMKFIMMHEDLTFVDTYIDNGQTGTNFHRPSFIRLMQDVERGRIHCIVVKDFSRFGRSYLEMGEYLEIIFPSQKLRFISVNDYYDSNCKSSQDDLIVPLKSILHDSYAKDISKKVSSTIEVKKRNGKFMNSKPPYGYVRSERDQYKLMIQKEQAEIVRKIFQWRLEGLGVCVIARRLNDMGVPTWRKLHMGDSHKNMSGLWRGSTVTNILKNPCYIGCLVERKGEKVLCKGGFREVIPKENWKLIKNTHEPILPREIFYEVQRMMGCSGK